ncbi:manganese-dependent inorganic pyrophosphatase [Fructobacillus evanidus]|uniref:inorganic diphosphatase n=1 Tax=Fructobacillus evanidus TaxID=3064281 RepID=A0ABN9YHV8_9LACO|nr:Inorganic pyrophosphatase/exopolyphosphatase (PPX1) [Fructobacillus sp. LMG 32999]CAK1222540.1 Inorganic pyrophosphatase/exopolyphosphatase (PPX1) [Fructobacillus sp. LMG 32999]CAK1223927.1 Inorganic pyrophosphatase/exopolyphosphatase (PPX1) [Fructobacillus sp. LMG 32999]CAK1224048.1 Inorganic pyrophosphatase/exopolyphosphatase (PPX1) [Fructobacillus sp. LMG 32999]CAK1224183.1 Inorganic pyrophosphatase/exopolyphosphatase (PPX1) [Fructobacillus sp. LMG 32999]
MAKIQVFGHKNPDTDTVASAMGAADLLAQQGLETQAVAQGKPNAETQFALDHFGLAALPIIDKAETAEVVLVDHNEAAQSVDNLADVQVYGIYDHHKFAFENATPLYITAKPWGSVSTILYYEYLQAGLTIPAKVAGMLASGLISDTLLLKSPTTTDVDRKALPELAKIAGIEDLDGYGLAMLKAGTDLSTRTDEELLEGDAKSFTMGSHEFRIGQVNTVDIDDVLARKEGLEKAIKAAGYEDFLFVITDILNSNSKGLYIGDAPEAIEAAFGAKLENDVIDLPGVVSRKKQVVPPLQGQF